MLPPPVVALRGEVGEGQEECERIALVDLETLGESVGVDDKDEDAVEEALAVRDGEDVLEGDTEGEGVVVNVGGWILPVGLLPPLELNVPSPTPNVDVPDPELNPPPYGLPDAHIVALAFPRDTERREDWLGWFVIFDAKMVVAGKGGEAVKRPRLDRPNAPTIDTSPLGW